MQANNLAAPATIHPGQQLVIPRYSTSPVAPRRAGTPPPAPAKPPRASQPRPPAIRRACGRRRRDAEQDFPLYGKPLGEIAKANNIQPSAKLNVGDA